MRFFWPSLLLQSHYVPIRVGLVFSIRLLVATREKYSESIRPLAAENFCLYEKEVRNTTKIERPFKAVSTAGALEKN